MDAAKYVFGLYKLRYIQMKELIMSHNLGGTQRPEDVRDFPLGVVQAPVDHPPVFMQNVAPVAILSQLKTPSCGAHAGNYLKMYEKYVELGMPQSTVSFSPRFLWTQIRALDGAKPDDGSNMRTIFKALQTKGTCDLSLCTNDSWLSNAQYCDPTAVTDAAKANALTNTVKSYAFLPPSSSFDDIKRAIYQNGGVLILMSVNEQMWTATNGTITWAESSVLPLRPATPAHPAVSGHFVFAHSYDQNYIYFANSWGTNWGRSGHGYFGVNYVSQLVEFGIALDLPLDLVNQLKKVAAPKFKTGDQVRVTAVVNVRGDATTIGKLLGEKSVGATGTIVNGPVINHGFVWWEVNYDQDPSGWSVEGNLSLVTAPKVTTPINGPVAKGSDVTKESWFIRLLRIFFKK